MSETETEPWQRRLEAVIMRVIEEKQAENPDLDREVVRALLRQQLYELQFEHDNAVKVAANLIINCESEAHRQLKKAALENPPKQAEFMLGLLLPGRVGEDLRASLYEQFLENCEQRGI